jgi:hypothetical protein
MSDRAARKKARALRRREAAGYTLDVRIVFFGSPDFALPTPNAMVEARQEVALVVS